MPRWWRSRFVLVPSVAAIALAGCATPPRAEGVGSPIAPREAATPPAPAALARTAFERLKRLEGRWEGEIPLPEGGASRVVSVFEVSAEGHAVVERGAIADPLETTTVYYLDRGVLRVTHYCAAGNQPRMYLNRHASPDRLAFSFAGITNVDDPDAFHMRLREIAFADDSVLLVRWEGVREGRVLPADVVRMRRTSE